MESAAGAGRIGNRQQDAPHTIKVYIKIHTEQALPAPIPAPGQARPARLVVHLMHARSHPAPGLAAAAVTRSRQPWHGMSPSPSVAEFFAAWEQLSLPDGLNTQYHIPHSSISSISF